MCDRCSKECQKLLDVKDNFNFRYWNKSYWVLTKHFVYELVIGIGDYKRSIEAGLQKIRRYLYIYEGVNILMASSYQLYPIQQKWPPFSWLIFYRSKVIRILLEKWRFFQVFIFVFLWSIFVQKGYFGWFGVNFPEKVPSFTR